ncbi:MAG: hypothetical protein IKK83_04640 [Clostridia bacterium]|nr:hypothetical protein [Clostridia bacterium]
MKKHRISDIITIVLFLSILFGFGAAFWILPDVDVSQVEGRPMQQTPSFTTGYRDNASLVTYTGTDYLLHGYLADEFDEYYCDQFPLRRFFLGLHAATESLSYRGVNGGVLKVGDELAVTRFDAAGFTGLTEYYSEEHVRAALGNLHSVCEGLDVPVKVMLPPRSIDVKAPFMGYPTEISDSLHLLTEEVMGEEYVELLSYMRRLMEDGHKPYFTTDHHWTVEGAYEAYATLMRDWGLTPYAKEDFEFVTVTEDFQGTTLRNGNYFYMEGESLQLARYEGDEDFTVTLLSKLLTPGEEYEGLYNFAATETEDAYSIFLHGKPLQMSITLEGAERETLLVYKDSFGHSLVPFLARHFDIFVLDNQSETYGNNISSAVAATGADRVLVVYNMENVIETGKLANLKG